MDHVLRDERDRHVAAYRYVQLVNFALSVDASSFMPAYVAAARTWKEQGLDVQFNIFRNDAEAAQALAGDSVDVTLQSFDGLLNLITANQPVIGFYAGFAQADFEWFAVASVKKWSDLKGQTVGVSSFGSLTDQLTQYSLRKNGLDPQKDVKLQKIGPSSAALAAMRSGRLGMGVQFERVDAAAQTTIDDFVDAHFFSSRKV